MIRIFTYRCLRCSANVQTSQPLQNCLKCLTAIEPWGKLILTSVTGKPMSKNVKVAELAASQAAE